MSVQLEDGEAAAVATWMLHTFRKSLPGALLETLAGIWMDDFDLDRDRETVEGVIAELVNSVVAGINLIRGETL